MHKRMILMKPAFRDGCTRIQEVDMALIKERIPVLANDPHPDGTKNKIRLLHVPGRPYRFRVGTYRIFYTFDHQYLWLHKIDRRRDDTYKVADDFDSRHTGALPFLNEEEERVDDVTDAAHSGQEPLQALEAHYKQNYNQPVSCRPLPQRITLEILRRLRVPTQCHASLLRARNEDDIWNCPGIDDDSCLHLIGYMFDKSLLEAMVEPDFILNDVNDLSRYREGALIAFLLKLSPEQERYARWSTTTTSATLLKGGPGTGKSTVAMYRVRSLLNQMLMSGHKRPSILFTTYTRTLVTASEQLLEQLLGANKSYVEVQMADDLANYVLKECNQAKLFAIASVPEMREIVAQILACDDAFESTSQRLKVGMLGSEYVLQEILQIILTQQIQSLEQYLAMPRSGRQMPLKPAQRTAIWHVYEQWCRQLTRTQRETWSQRRLRASHLVAQTTFARRYDAVIIDEAQDLDLSILKMLIQMCKNQQRLLIAADANQSIYTSGFTWKEVEACLDVPIQPCVLHANYRSTAEIDRAAHHYLAHGALERVTGERSSHYSNSGPMPAFSYVQTREQELEILVRYFKHASRKLSLPLGSCALLCTTDEVGRQLAEQLTNKGVNALFMKWDEVDLTRPGVKVLVQRYVKGLEFPIVALAGFVGTNYPIFARQPKEEEVRELLTQERRVLFVGMTRAMRTLHVVLPSNPVHLAKSLFEGFNSKYWSLQFQL